MTQETALKLTLAAVLFAVALAVYPFTVAIPDLPMPKTTTTKVTEAVMTHWEELADGDVLYLGNKRMVVLHIDGVRYSYATVNRVGVAVE